MIESGEKREEYREIKPYWIKRFERHKYDIHYNDIDSSMDHDWDEAFGVAEYND